MAFTLVAKNMSESKDNTSLKARQVVISFFVTHIQVVLQGGLTDD